ncbi:dienelactone hydrolase family protein [Auricularia subglabra TFB-10046 SS5]|nr:dienelactone hydrolase family protein [Auricularia subglabra TFB-10046 SS5]
MSFHPCCVKGFEWDGTPTGRVGKLAGNDAYISGESTSTAVLLVHDAMGWTHTNMRLLADHYAREANATVRETEIFACARKLRETYKKIGAVGYCYGGWVVFRLGAKEHAAAPLVDCISTGHPTLLTTKDIDEVAVPVQVLAPEFDPVYTPELKAHTFHKLQELGVPFDYQHFPGVEHACFSRGDENKPGERAALERGKNAVVAWFVQHLST